MPRIVVMLMCKNEEAVIKKTLDWYDNPVYSHIYVLDTGSSDQTIPIIQEEMSKNVPISLFEKPFVDFSTNRNYLMSKIREAESSDTWILAVDCNDELQNHEVMAQYVDQNKEYDAIALFQVWKALNDTVVFKNIRLVKNNGVFQYKYRIHENFVDTSPDQSGKLKGTDQTVDQLGFRLYQLRDPEYETPRLQRLQMDIDYLLQDQKDFPDDTRLPYYIAQTYLFMQSFENCKKWCDHRIAQNVGKPKEEEVYFSYVRWAKCNYFMQGNRDDSHSYLWKAWNYLHDVEPILIMSDDYVKDGDFTTAYHLLRMGCDIQDPNFTLPYVRRMYTYDRWVYLARVAFILGQFDEAANALAVASRNTEPNIPEFIKNIHDIILQNVSERQKMFQNLSKKIVCMFGGNFYDRKWNGLYYSQGLPLGGSESSFIKLAETLSEDFEVFCFTDTDVYVTFNKVRYMPLNEYEKFVNSTMIDHLIVSRHANMLRYLNNITFTHFWLHDLTFIGNGFVNNDKLASIICQSEFHRKFFLEFVGPDGANLIQDKTVVITHSIDSLEQPSSTPRVQHRFVYTSCPSRGLEKVVDDFIDLVQAVPTASLHVMSDFDNSYVRSAIDVPKLLEKIQGCPQIVNKGRLSSTELRQELCEASYWYYPTTFQETFCINALEAMAAGVVPIYNPVGSLPEVIGNAGIKITNDFNLAKTLSVLSMDGIVDAIRERCYARVQAFSNAKSKQNWMDLLDSPKVFTKLYKQLFTRTLHLQQKHKDKMMDLKQKGFEPKVIFDIGSATLSWSHVANEVWPDAKILHFDANIMMKEYYDEMKIDYFIGLLSNTDDVKKKFFTNFTTPWGSSCYIEQSEYFNDKIFIEMATHRLDTIVKKNKLIHPDLLKIDVEGSELDILQGAVEVLERAQHLFVECQTKEHNRGAPMLDEVSKHLEKSGYHNEGAFDGNGDRRDYHFSKTVK